MISTDIFSDTGTNHHICEDYIIQGDNPVPYIILADGCSSSKDTDVGARILCYLAKQYINYYIESLRLNTPSEEDQNHHKMGQWIIYNAEMASRQLGLSKRCLDSTLIISFLCDEQLSVYMYGDGIIAYQKDGVTVIITTEYTKNAPFYLSYLIDDERMDNYHEMKTEQLVKTYIDGKLNHEQSFAYDYKGVFRLPDFENRCDSLLVCSDGIQSFIVKDSAQRRVIKVHDIIPDLMSFKTLKGCFLKRRMNILLKNFNKNGIGHFDDLSVGAFLTTKE